MQYFDYMYLQDTYNIHETFVKVPQSHYIHNKVVKFVLSQDRQKKITQLFSKLETVLHQLVKRCLQKCHRSQAYF